MQDLFCNSNDWLSIYRNDFGPKSVEPRPQLPVRDTPDPFFHFERIQKHKEPKNDDPIQTPYRNYLEIKNCRMKPGEPAEKTEDFLKRFHDSHPELSEKYFKVPPRSDFLCTDYEQSLQSIYQRDICRPADIVQKGKRPATLAYIDLPDSWYFPTSTHRWSYRNPRLFIDRDVRSTSVKPEATNFKFSDEMQKIMKISTGTTEYRNKIGELGEFIIEKEMYGEIKK